MCGGVWQQQHPRCAAALGSKCSIHPAALPAHRGPTCESGLRPPAGSSAACLSAGHAWAPPCCCCRFCVWWGAPGTTSDSTACGAGDEGGGGQVGAIWGGWGWHRREGQEGASCGHGGHHDGAAGPAGGCTLGEQLSMQVCGCVYACMCICMCVCLACSSPAPFLPGSMLCVLE